MDNNYKYPQVTEQIRAFGLMGLTGGQQFNGDFGYCRIAPESALIVLLDEFTPITLLPGFNFN